VKIGPKIKKQVFYRRQTFMPSAGFKPTIPAIMCGLRHRPQTPESEDAY